ncbi:MAG TPA: hypothetical protein VLG71_00505, partial [Candidatus Limnocylindria bacterium]|nr:hypothetical protein [Candidatus Limnocylindria bacterium]
SNDKTIKEWQANNPRAIHTYKGHTDGVTCLAALSRGNFISASKDNTIKEWKSKAEKPLISYESADSQKPMAVTCLTELANDNFIAGSSDGTITEWSPAEKAVVRTYKAHSKEITCLARLDNGNFLSGSMDGTIKQWKPGTLKPIAMYPLFDTVALSITVNTDQTFIVPLGNDQLYMFSSDVRTDLEKAIDSPRHKAKQTGK